MPKKKDVKKVSTVCEVKKPRILLFDIETAPLLGYVWSLWDNDIALNQIHSDWHILSWSAKWLDDPPTKIMYVDQRAAKKIEDDGPLLKQLWELLDQADIVVTQNGKHFDVRKVNARFIMNGFKPPSSYKHIDTKILAQKYFGFSSVKLEYLSEKLCPNHKKIKHEKFPGFELWRECLAGNNLAWQEMERYNRADVLALEELYRKLIPWDNSVNMNLYTDGNHKHVCQCGSKSMIKKGFYYTTVSKFQRYRCKRCGAETRGRVNLFSKEKRDTLRVCTER